MTRSHLVFALAAGFALVACGKVGALEQPAPLYGEKAKSDYQAKKAAADAKKQAKKDQDEIERLPTDGHYDPNADPSPSRNLPVVGQPSSANPTPPPGLMPDPINNPPPR